MKYTIRYVHKISQSPADANSRVEFLNQDLADRVREQDLKGLGALLRNTEVLGQGARVREARVEADGRIVIFPTIPGMTTYWHSVILTPM